MEKRRQKKIDRRESNRSIKEKGIIFGAYVLFALIAVLSESHDKQMISRIFSQIFLILGIVCL